MPLPPASLRPFRTLGSSFLAVAAALWLTPPSAATACSDLALVLAIDSSGSIDPAEFAVQVLGYSEAFRNPGVQRALAATGVVEVAAVYWADADWAPQIIPWHRIASPRDAEAFAWVLRSMPRLASGDTDIGNGLDRAIDLFALTGCSHRRIVNVSGDGRESGATKRKKLIPLAHARDRAAAAGITVNALAIENEDAGLADYYRDRLITGSGAFVMQVRDFATFGDAIAIKLEREVSLTATAALR